MIQAEIINIGDELLIGQVVNTNASWLGEVLSSEGLEVKKITAIADQREQILSTLGAAVETVQVVIITGGLGPTRDDITKDVLCSFFNTSLVFNEDAFRSIETFFAARGLPVTTLNRGQAMLPADCQPLPNPNGTAAGMWFERDGVIVISLPGVPHEMKPMVMDHVMPRLRAFMHDEVLVHSTVLTHGMGESFLARRIEAWELALPGHIKLAYLPSPGIVRLRLTARGPSREAMLRDIAEARTNLESLIPELIFGYDRDTLESVAGSWLLARSAMLGVAESCTGGYLAHLMTSVPGSSRYFAGGVVAYDNAIKVNQLGVDPALISMHGAVSREVVEAMAEGVRDLLQTHYALATSGIAGPDGGTADKPVGSIWIAVTGPHGTFSKHFQFGHARERNIRLASLSALNMLRTYDAMNGIGER